MEDKIIYNGLEYIIIHKSNRLLKYINNQGSLINYYPRSDTYRKGRASSNGKYLRTDANIYAKDKKEYIHRLVAIIFVPNPENKSDVDHIDTNKLNNVYTNLKWVTKSENMLNPITRKNSKKAHNINNKKGKNHPMYGKKRYDISKKVILIIDGKTIIKNSRVDMIEFIKENYGVSGDSWIRKKERRFIDKKFKNRIQFVGYLDSEEYLIYIKNQETTTNDSNEGNNRVDKLLNDAMDKLQISIEDEEWLERKGF